MPEHIGNISSLISKKSPPPKRVPSRIEILEGRVRTLESALATLIKEVRALRAAVERLEKTPPKATPQTKPEKPQPAAPPPKTAKSKPKQPWDDPQRLAEISELADRILVSSNIESLTKAEVVSHFDVDTKLAGQTLAWMVMKKTMRMHTPEPTEDNPDPKNVFSAKSG